MNSRRLLDPGEVRRKLCRLTDCPRVDFGRFDVDEVDELTPAAVLAPLTEIEDRFHLVFTSRPETMPEHSGEVSFPGGRVEQQDDSLMDAALRETEEEIGLARKDVQVFGNLVHMPTVTGYDVTVYVGEFDQSCRLDPNPREIEELFMVPLDELAEPSRHRVEQRSWREQTFELHFYDYDDHIIWGATGYMVYELLRLLELNEIQPGEK